jgi:hypothetical protein
MGPVMGIGQASREDVVIIPVGIASPATEACGDRSQIRLRRQEARLLDDPVLVARQGRPSIHAFRLERHPVRP